MKIDYWISILFRKDADMQTILTNAEMHMQTLLWHLNNPECREDTPHAALQNPKIRLEIRLQGQPHH